jgi:hypothetical protein
MFHFVRRVLHLVALAILFPTSLLFSAPSYADYQAAVREATERYRGDCNEGIFSGDREYFYGSYKRDIRDNYLRAFDDFQFTLSLLPRFAPNQTMQLAPMDREQPAFQSAIPLKDD